MEPAKAPMRYVLVVPVVFAFDGWIRFDGSQERMFFGQDCPFDLGDQVKITFEKVEQCPPSPTTSPTSSPNAS